MHICFITTVLDALKGGNILPLLKATPDCRFTILTNRARLVSDLPEDRFQIIELKERLGPYYYGIADWRFARAVLRHYPVHDPFWKQCDVIHLSQTLGTPFIRLQESGIPILYTIHHPAAADRKVVLEESTGLERLRWRLRYAPLVRAQRTICHRIRHLHTEAHVVAKDIGDFYHFDGGRMHVVPYGVDPEEFTPAFDASQEHDVVAVGSFLHPRKGFPYLLEAYRQLAASGLRIADVGRRSDEQQQALNDIPGVTVFGPVDQPTVVRLIRTSACLLSTSLYEGFGLPNVEALACGRPCFAFSVGAVPEVVGGIDPELLAPARDVDGLVRRIRAFLALPAEERRRRGERYRAAVVEKFPWARGGEMLGNLYRHVSVR